MPSPARKPQLEYVDCAFCHTKEHTLLHVIRGCSLVECPQCGLICTNPRMIWDYQATPGDFEAELDIYRRHYWPPRRQSAIRMWPILEPYCLTGRLLDVGSSYGFFLAEAQDRGWQAVGVEPSSDQAAYASRHFGLKIVADLASRELAPHSFDVLTLWDVIEHIADSHNFLQKCHTLLRPGGLLLLKTPNAQGLIKTGPWWLRPYLALYWQLIYPANPLQHYYHFTPSILERLLEDTGFTVIQTDTDQDWSERPITGRNFGVTLARYPLMWLACRLSLPYEMTFLAEPLSTSEV